MLRKGRPGTGLSLLASLLPASRSKGWAQTDRSIPAAVDVGKQLALKKERFLKGAVQEKEKEIVGWRSTITRGQRVANARQRGDSMQCLLKKNNQKRY
jgi:hypothetical protein